MMAESTASNRQSDDDDDYMADLSRFLPSDDAIIHPSIPTKSSSKRVTFIQLSIPYYSFHMILQFVL